MIESTLKMIWSTASHSLHLQAGLFCRIDNENDECFVRVESSYAVPEAPFNGSENNALVNVVRECIKIPKTHEHDIGNWALSNIIKKFNNKLHVARVAVVARVTVDYQKYILLAFPKDNTRHGLFASAEGVCKVLAETVSVRTKNIQNAERLKVMELYIREIGHDLAGCMQAIIAKMTYIAKGNLNESAMRTKASEAYKEARNAYAVAECLGIAVDNNYSIGNSATIDLNEFIAEIATDYESEAKEKNINLKIPNCNGYTIFGDKLPLKLAVSNIIKNSIKYGYSDTDVEIDLREENDRIVIIVRNKGIGLPGGSERKNIWEFGYRSERARKINVNGSGIGLYSCKKVALTHDGQVWEEEHKGVTIFNFSLPKSRFRRV